MGSSPSPELVGKTVAWIMIITITSVMFITAITFFNYKYTEIMFNNIRLGNIYIFDAITKYKQVVMYSLSLLFLVVFIFRVSKN